MVLGEFTRETPQEQVFSANVKNYTVYPWRLAAFWDLKDTNIYTMQKMTITIVNNDMLHLITSSMTGPGPYDSRRIEVPRGEFREVYTGSVAEFIGSIAVTSFPYLSVWSEDGDQLRFDVRITICGPKPNLPFRIGLIRSEPAL